MKTARTITLVLCVTATAIISGFINIMGGIGICFFVETSNATYKNCGICLFISSAFLILGTIIACFKKVWIPLAANIIGSAFYIYTVSQLYAIPNTLISKSDTEPLAERHLLTVIVTILLLALTVFNYFDEKNVSKRNIKQKEKQDKLNRKLTDEEKII